MLNIHFNTQAQIQAVGDVFLADTQKNLFAPSFEYFKNEEYLNVINLEGAITKSEKSIKCSMLGNPCFAFKQNPSVVKQLKEANIKVVNLANNHSFDYGLQGSNDTVEYLIRSEIVPIGIYDHNFKKLFHKGRKYFFIGLSPHMNTQSIFDLNPVIKEIKKAKEEGFIVVVSAHLGAEGNNQFNLTNNDEIFMGKNRGNPMKIARKLIDEGTDLFLGHGPHVLRPLELYKNKLIAYSLGNFLTYGTFQLSGNLGLGGILRVELKENGDFLEGMFFGFRQTKEFNKKLWNKEVAIEAFDGSLLFLKEITKKHQEKYKTMDIVWNNNQFISNSNK